MSTGTGTFGADCLVQAAHHAEHGIEQLFMGTPLPAMIAEEAENEHDDFQVILAKNPLIVEAHGNNPERLRLDQADHQRAERLPGGVQTSCHHGGNTAKAVALRRHSAKLLLDET